jgi:hypothetical protein
MKAIKIYYKTEKDDCFVHHDIHAQYYIELNFDSKQVSWCFYLPLPEGMHWKAGDQMGGLGADHHTKTQSFAEFIETPHLEMPAEDYAEALSYIQGVVK